MVSTSPEEVVKATDPYRALTDGICDKTVQAAYEDCVRYHLWLRHLESMDNENLVALQMTRFQLEVSELSLSMALLRVKLRMP